MSEMRNEGQYRILYFYQLLQEHTDEEHKLSTNEIIALMEQKHGIKLHRTTVPKYVDVLNNFGFEVNSVRGRNLKYYLSSRTFELPELKLLIDGVRSSHFISAEKSDRIVEKLLALASRTEADKLTWNMQYTGARVKSNNEKSFYIVDAVNTAINEGRQISFYYTDYDYKKRKQKKNGGKPYIISPYAMIENSDYYYLVGYNHAKDIVAHFRMDRIFAAPEILEKSILPPPEDFDLEQYSDRIFRMYAPGPAVDVVLQCEGELMKHVIDQFGIRVKTAPVSKGIFRAYVKVVPGPTFYRWVFGWGGKMKILEPSEVREEYREMARKAAE